MQKGASKKPKAGPTPVHEECDPNNPDKQMAVPKTKCRHWLMAMIYLGAPLAMPRHLDDGQELVLESLRLLQCPDMSAMKQTNWFIFIHCHVYDISGWYFMCSSNGMCVWRNVEGKPGRMSCTLSKRDASLLTLLQCPDMSSMNQTNWFISPHCHVFNMSGWMDYLICFSRWEWCLQGWFYPKRTPSWCKGLFLADGVLVRLMDGVLGANQGQSRISRLAT